MMRASLMAPVVASQFRMPLTLLIRISSSSRLRLRSSPLRVRFSPTPSSMGKAQGQGHPSLRGKVFFSAQSNLGVDREILVQHLLIKGDNLKLLSELQQKISGGTDLSDLAVKHSICPSKEEGGMLGWVRRGQMVVMCKTKFGWHLLQVLSEREACLLQDITPDELHMKMQDPSFVQEVQLIDVREPEEVITRESRSEIILGFQLCKPIDLIAVLAQVVTSEDAETLLNLLAQASLPGFVVLPLRQFGSWGPEITSKFDLQKDTYVLTSSSDSACQSDGETHSQDVLSWLLPLEKNLTLSLVPNRVSGKIVAKLGNFYIIWQVGTSIGQSGCHHGMRSLQVAKWLQTQGFRRVFNVAGGIHAYALKADASIPTY
ncbi:Peptidyl-prolyl cis-trans isomerase, PpiC-type [Dillenia turbinata]|uniref:Peptidyl-prolyl cis-trans isomerase, PpiC-type n=1 Tax=Dillenia turbinata TaxID=194707 RepID=A0AAN8VW71_9MAGN